MAFRLLLASCLAQLLAGSMYLLPLPGIGPDGAFEDCPCTDHLNATTWPPGQPPGHFPWVARNYGSSRCEAWDIDGLGTPECRGAAAPSYCERSWCYVNPAACDVRRRPKRSAMFKGLYFSYTTCGNVDDYLVKPPVPIVVYSFGHKISEDVPGRSAAWRAMASLTHHIFEHMLVPEQNVVYRHLSNASRAQFGSEYSACVYDLALGHLDLCVGDFWDTPDRRSFRAGFSTTIYSEYLYMYIGMKNVDLSFWEMLHQPIKPFTFELWALIGGVMVASGLALALFELHRPGSEFEFTSVLGAVSHSSFLSFRSFVDGGISYSPRAKSGKIFAIGLGLFICITIASFTANTASFLIYEARAADIRNLADALEKGMAVCSFKALEQEALLSFPALEQLGVFLDETADIMAAMDLGRCRVALLPEPLVKEFQSKGEHCELQAAGRPVLAFPTGMYVADHIQHHFNWAAAAKCADGTWAALEPLLIPKSACEARSEAAERQGPVQLKAHHMYGNCLLLLLCLAISMAVHFCGKVEKSEAIQRVEHAAMDTIEHRLHVMEHHISDDSAPHGSNAAPTDAEGVN